MLELLVVPGTSRLAIQRMIPLLLSITFLAASCQPALTPSESKAFELSSMPLVGEVRSQLDPANNAMTLAWEPIDQVTGYSIQQQIGSGAWSTLFDTVTITKQNFPLPSLGQRFIDHKPEIVNVRWRVAAISEKGAGEASEVKQQLSFDYTILPVDGTLKYKVIDTGDSYLAEMRVRNDSNVTLHNVRFIMWLFDSPPWFDGGTGAYSTAVRVAYPDPAGPGEVMTFWGSVQKIPGFVFTTAYMATTPEFSLH